MMPPPKARKSGFTLLEVTLVVALMAIAVVALIGTLARLPLVDKAQDEEIIALQAAQTKIEELENHADVDFGSLWIRYNSDQNDDPADGVSPGANFAVNGILASPDDADGLAGEVAFPEINGILDETADWGDAELHIDDNPDSDDPVSADDYLMLPVRIHVRFRSATGHDIIKTLETTLYGVR